MHSISQVFITRSLYTLGLLAILFSPGIAQAQRKFIKTPIANTQAVQLLTSGDAQKLRNELVSKQSAKVGQITVAEKYTFASVDTSLSVELVSQSFALKTGSGEQISVKITENGKTSFINVFEKQDGSLSQMVNGNIVPISNNSGNEVSKILACIGTKMQSLNSCTTCRNKVNACVQDNKRYVGRLRCLMSTIDGTCLRCVTIGSYAALLLCLLVG